VSPKEGWKLSKLKAIMCSAYFWDPCIRFLLPPWRRTRSFCIDLHHKDTNLKFPNNQFRTPKFKAGFYPPLDAPKGVDPLEFLICRSTAEDVRANMVDIMTSDSFSSVHEKFWNPGVRNSGWNISHMSEQSVAKNTVELRRPPASVTAADAIGWIELIVSFTFAAFDEVENCASVEYLSAIKRPGLAEFKNWLKPYRFQISDPSIGDVLDNLFENAIKSGCDKFIYLDEVQTIDLLEARAAWTAKTTDQSQTVSASNNMAGEPVRVDIGPGGTQLALAYGHEIVYDTIPENVEDLLKIVHQQIRENILNSMLQNGGML
jgi:hypothetical protein